MNLIQLFLPKNTYKNIISKIELSSVNLFVFGGHCCVENYLDDLNIGNYNLRRVNEIVLADIIIFYGAINKNLADEFKTLYKGLKSKPPVIQIGDCESLYMKEINIKGNILGCPPRSDEIERAIVSEIELLKKKGLSEK